MKATRKAISTDIPEVEVIEIAKSRRILEAIKRIVKSIVKAVAITYSKIAIFRKKNNDYDNEDNANDKTNDDILCEMKRIDDESSSNFKKYSK